MRRHKQEEEGTALSRCVADFLSSSADTTLLLLGEVGHAPALYLAASPACAHSRCRTMDCLYSGGADNARNAAMPLVSLDPQDTPSRRW